MATNSSAQISEFTERDDTKMNFATQFNVAGSVFGRRTMRSDNIADTRGACLFRPLAARPMPPEPIRQVASESCVPHR